MIRKHPETLTPVFVHSSASDSEVTAERFLGLMSSEAPSDTTHLRVYEWFTNYVNERGTGGNTEVLLCIVCEISMQFRTQKGSI